VLLVYVLADVVIRADDVELAGKHLFVAHKRLLGRMTRRYGSCFQRSQGCYGTVGKGFSGKGGSIEVGMDWV
jgi:hypothetical protein